MTKKSFIQRRCVYFFKKCVASYLQIESHIYQRDYFKSSNPAGKNCLFNSRREIVLWIILHNLTNQWVNLCQKKKQKQKKENELNLTSG